jgi:cytochrome c oxidase assembly protein subunit 15
MLGLCWGGWPVLGREGLLAGALLALALFLAGLGVLTPGARVPAVAMGNLLGGFLMLAFSARLALARGGAPALGAAAVATAALLLVQIGGGALVSASHAGLSCAGWADCAERAAASGGELRLLDPWREPVFDAGAWPPNPDGALAQALHRLGGVLLLPVLVLLGIAARRRGRARAGTALIGLALLQLTLGVVIASFGLPLAAVLAHNLVAALLLALMLHLV